MDNKMPTTRSQNKKSILKQSLVYNLSFLISGRAFCMHLTGAPLYALGQITGMALLSRGNKLRETK